MAACSASCSASPSCGSRATICHRDPRFGEIIRLVLENWTSVTKGSFGLSNLSRPSLFGMEMGVTEATNYIYYIVLAAVVVTIIVVGRLKTPASALPFRLCVRTKSPVRPWAST